MGAKMSRAARMLLMRPDRVDRMESKFRDGRGREHYDNGRYAPMRNDTNIEIEGRFRDHRGRERFEDGRFAPVGWDTWPMEGRYPDRSRATPMEGGDGVNPIGFHADREWTREPMDEMAYRTGPKMSGHARGSRDWVAPMDKETAERWVRSMRNAEGAPGQHWTLDQAKQIMARHGYQDDPVEFYAALNMMKSDYTQAALKLGVDSEEFYAAMADAFLNDEDAAEDKLARYYHAIARGN